MSATECSLSHKANPVVGQAECSTQESDLHEYLEKYFSLSAREAAIRVHHLYSIEIEVTKACNLECLYCYSESSPRKYESLPLDVLRRVLREGYDYGLRSVSWFGGEPLLYGPVVDALRYAKELGYEESVLYTNGTRLSPEVVKSLRPWVDTVAIHLDTLSPELFSQVHYDKDFVQVTRMHTAVLEGFQNLLAGGFAPDDVRLTLTLSRPIFEDLPRLLHWAFVEMRFQTSIFLPIIPFGRASHLSHGWFPTGDQIIQAYGLRAKMERRPYLLNLGIAEYCKQYQMTMCYVQADGRVTPYAGSNAVCGSLSGCSIAQIIERNYGTLAFLRYSNGLMNSPPARGCYRCHNERYCFGTPVTNAQSIECPFRTVRT